MPVLTSPKKLYKRMIPILVKSHLYILNIGYMNDQNYGNWRSKGKTWKIFVTEDYASLQYEHCVTRIKWIWKNGEDS